jgi:hypothetical protein
MANLIEFSDKITSISYRNQESLTTDRIKKIAIIYGLTNEQWQLYYILSLEVIKEKGMKDAELAYLPDSVCVSIHNKLHEIIREF